MAIETFVNLNNKVRFQLTEHGKKVWQELAEAEASQYRIGQRRIPYVEGSQEVEMQLWDFSNFLGSRFNVGMPNVIEENNLRIIHE